MPTVLPSSDNTDSRSSGTGLEADTLPGVSETNMASVDWQPVLELIKRLPSYARLIATMAKDKRVPKSAKSFLVVAAAYLVSPIGLIPGLIPVAGQLDDLYIVLTGLQLAIRLTPHAVVDEHLAKVGLASDSVSNDLAALRAFVRQGIQWTFQRGGMAMVAVGRQAMSLVERART